MLPVYVLGIDVEVITTVSNLNLSLWIQVLLYTWKPGCPYSKIMLVCDCNKDLIDTLEQFLQT